MNMWQKITLVLGIVGLLLSGLFLIIFGVIVATGGGRISGEEAAIPFGIGGCCCFLSLVVAVVGLIVVLKARKNVQPPEGTPPRV
jgi:hypothetical protein